MIDTAVTFFYEFRDNFRIADAVDIALMSLILYAVLLWFKEAASRRVLIGVSVVLAVYFVARALDMYLTSLVFHTGFAVLVILLIVVFQEDLRRMLERVAGFRALRSFQQNYGVPINLDTLVEASFHMASLKIGALIVLKGRDPLARHLEGGIPLDGEISKPLLYSIFDASSAGHDGAVVIEGDRISKFAVHLPISKSHDKIAGRGTRHGAALGLSERCDALTIVVSEERGAVSLAEAGTLRVADSAATLVERLTHFYETHHTEKPRGRWTHYFTRHGRLKLLAAALAITAWFVLAYNPSTIQRTFIVPIEYRNLAENMLLNDAAPAEARMTLSGSEHNFRFLEPGNLRVTVDLSGMPAGTHEIDISEDNIRLPSRLTIYRISPRVLPLELRNEETKEE